MKALLVIMMSLCLHVTYAQKPDTTKTFIQGKELDEVVVKSSYLTREGDHILAIPTKEQRKHAVTGYDSGSVCRAFDWKCDNSQWGCDSLYRWA